MYMYRAGVSAHLIIPDCTSHDSKQHSDVSSSKSSCYITETRYTSFTVCSRGTHGYRRAWASLWVASMKPAMTWLELSAMSCCIHSMATSSLSPSRSFSCIMPQSCHSQVAGSLDPLHISL